METQILKTPHPVTLEGQERIFVDVRPGESLFSFLSRHVENLDGEPWHVSIGGKEVPRHMWHHVYPCNGNFIEVRGDLGRNAIAMVAVAALSIWTGWALAAVASSGGIAGMGVVASYATIAGVNVAGALLINKVLSPKVPSADASSPERLNSLAGSQNQLRQNGAVPILMGHVRDAPDLLSKTYNWFQDNDMYLGMHLCWGIGVGRIETLYLGDTPVSDYDEAVQTWHSGFSEMPTQTIPLFGNVDTLAGGALQDDDKNLLTVSRTTSLDTTRIQWDFTGNLYDYNRKGKLIDNSERLGARYRKVGTSTWLNAPARFIRNASTKTLRITIAVDVEQGQYETEAYRYGIDTDGNSATCAWSLDTLTSVQKDTSEYRGVARSGLALRANARLTNTPDEVRAVAWATPVPVWNGTAWEVKETSNPGAWMLKYMRGWFDEDGKLIAGMGAADDDIDIPALQAFMLYCESKGFTYDYLLTEERNHQEALDAIAGAGLGQYTDANGLYSVCWVSQDQPTSGVVNMARIIKDSFQIDYSLVATADGVIVSYIDSETWEPASVRIPMPGVQTMLNPARLPLEGVTNVAHATLLGRYYLAQSLYQSKDISFSVNLEYLTFRRLSVLQMSHDITQWGYSGALVSAERSGGNIVVQLDDIVPPPTPGRMSYIGIRVPGQRTARVFEIVPFDNETDRVTLRGPWPEELAFPGNNDGNPAHDTIWIYDFKEVPGLTVRVVNITPAGGFKTANISVVAESSEFWEYVSTGRYEPPTSGSLLRTRPVASDLRISEEEIVTGNVVSTELTASWAVDGPYARAIVQCAGIDGTLETVAETTSRTATWPIPGASEYTVVVTPYNPQGLRGTPVSASYTTVDADRPPVNVDYFNIEDLAGGVRRYSWGYDPDTTQSPNFAGVQIRYTAGSVASPDWATMTPLGDDEGSHTTAFESILPVAGMWTFAIRAFNTNGALSTSIRTVQRALTSNVGELLTGIDQQLSDTQADLTEVIEQVDINAESIIQQALDISEVNGKAVENRAYISELRTTKVDQGTATAIAQTQIGVQTGDLRATVQQTSEAVANINGTMSAGWSVKVQLDNNGRYYMAGIGVGIAADGETVQSEVAVYAQTFTIMDQNGSGGYFYPFQVTGGAVYINNAFIRDASITNAKIGEFIQSSNYEWDDETSTHTGWQINKDGSARFGGDVTVRGDVLANRILGTYQVSVLVDWTGSVSAGNSSEFSLASPLGLSGSHRPSVAVAIQLQTGDGQDATSCTITLQKRLASESVWATVTTKTYAVFKFSNIGMAFNFLDSATTEPLVYRFAISQGSGQAVNMTAITGTIIGVR